MATTRSVPMRSHVWEAASRNTRQPPGLCLGHLLSTLPLGRSSLSCMSMPTGILWVHQALAQPTTHTSDFSPRKACTAGRPTSQHPTAGLLLATSSRAATRRPRADTSSRTRPVRPRAAPASLIPPCPSSLTMVALPTNACRPTYDSCLTPANLRLSSEGREQGTDTYRG